MGVDEQLTFGIAQISSEPANLPVNLKKAREAVIEAKEKGAQIVCFPELLPSGYCLEELGEEIVLFYKHNYDSILRFFSETALQTEVYIALPTGIPRQTGILENGLVCFAPSGKVKGIHSKFHLWENEKKYFALGEETLFMQVGETTVSFAICYDLGFPEVCRYLGKKAGVIFAPSAWDISGFRLWELNLSQRAAENTVFTIGVNAVGKFKGVHLFGRSMVCGPTGNVIFELPVDMEKVEVFSINMKAVKDAKRLLPYEKDKRPDLYARWFSDTSSD